MRIFLSEFVDFVLATSSKKATQVKAIMRAQLQRQEQKQSYNTFEDWLPVRNAIQAYLRNGVSGAELENVVESANPNRQARYQTLVAGFRSFRGRRALKWVEPGAVSFTHGALAVSCKPDLGIEDRGVTYFLKLHYGARPPSNERVSVIAQTMRSSMKVPSGVRFGVLDLRRGTVRSRLASASMADALEEEAETFISYWNRYRPESGRDVA